MEGRYEQTPIDNAVATGPIGSVRLALWPSHPNCHADRKPKREDSNLQNNEQLRQILNLLQRGC